MSAASPIAIQKILSTYNLRDLRPLFRNNAGGQNFLSTFPYRDMEYQNTQHFTLAPSGAMVSGSLTTTPITFKLDPGVIKGVMRCFSLVIGISETGGVNPVTPIAMECLFDRVVILANNNPNDVIQTIPGDMLYLKNQFIANEQLTEEIAFNSANMNNSYAGETAITAGTTTYYQIRIPHCVLEKMNMNTVSGSFLIQVYPRETGISSGTGNSLSHYLFF